jgi:hypothetical protein
VRPSEVNTSKKMAKTRSSYGTEAIGAVSKKRLGISVTQSRASGQAASDELRICFEDK